jgi:hypothetical protein
MDGNGVRRPRTARGRRYPSRTGAARIGSKGALTMAIGRAAKDFARHFHERSATLFLLLLLGGDLAYFALHVVNRLMHWSPLLDIETDRGYGEFYQYMKYAWILAMLGYAMVRWATRQYLAWIVLFTYLLLDDSMSFHEMGGWYFAQHVQVVPILGLRVQDFGELAVTAVAGAAVLIPLAWAWRSGDQLFRRISEDLALVTALLLFFGIVVDMAHSAIHLGRLVNFLLGMVEDGGEMLAASVIAWYVYLITVRREDPQHFLSDAVRRLVVRRPVAPVPASAMATEKLRVGKET